MLCIAPNVCWSNTYCETLNPWLFTITYESVVTIAHVSLVTIAYYVSVVIIAYASVVTIAYVSVVTIYSPKHALW